MMRTILLGSITSLFWTVSSLDANTVEEAIPELADIPTSNSYNHVGGANFGVCCLRAVQQSYRVIDGPDKKRILENFTPNEPTPFLQLDPDALRNLGKKQFPCTAEYETGKNEGAPIVKVPYRWCRDNCPGWQKSHNRDLSEWIQPFVGYILPAAVFALSVPRKRVLNIPEALFPNKVGDVVNFLSEISKAWGERDLSGSGSAIFHALFHIVWIILDMIFRAAIAAFIGFIDTLLWTAVVFSTSGPMIVSGLYEANVDRQVITYIERVVSSEKKSRTPEIVEPEGGGKVKGAEHKGEISTTTSESKKNGHKMEVTAEKGHTQASTDAWGDVRHKVHLIYAVLVGNLALDVRMPKVQDSESNIPKPFYSNAWEDVANLVSVLDSDGAKRNGDSERAVLEATRSRLHTMMNSQARFGATVAAALCFFLGSFLVNVVGNFESLGDNDTSHALAFGEWWMTVPFVAIVAGCLLAGNNPNTLEGVMSGTPFGHKRVRNPARDDAENKDKFKRKLQFLKDMFKRPRKEVIREFIMPYLYPKVYEPVWMWERGRNKRRWIERVQDLHRLKKDKPTDEKHNWVKKRMVVLNEKFSAIFKSNDSEDLKKLPLPYTTIPDWTFILILVIILILIPFTLAFLTSYYTPIIGLGCRSFTFVLYFLCQILLSIIWLVDFTGARNTFVRSKSFHECNFEKVDDRPIRGRHGKIGFGIAFFAVMFISCFSTIAGTFMQIVGVYRNCKCLVPMAHWGNPNFLVVLSSNAADDIRYAGLYWKNNGIAAIVLLAVVCYAGWWYQRHWRLRLSALIDDVIHEKAHEEIAPALAAEMSGAKNNSEVGQVVKGGSSDSGQPEVTT